jgi:hypothetical protein
LRHAVSTHRQRRQDGNNSLAGDSNRCRHTAGPDRLPEGAPVEPAGVIEHRWNQNGGSTPRRQ